MNCRRLFPCSKQAGLLSAVMLLLAQGLLGLLILGQAALGSSDPLWALTGESTVSSVGDTVAGGDFELQTLNGERFRLSDLNGKVVLLFFGYTACPDVCPVTLAQLKQVRALLGEASSRVAFVFVSVDPERDTPEILKTYLSHFDEGEHPAGTIGLLGTRPQLDRVLQTFHIAVQRIPNASKEAGGYSIDHSASLYVIAPDGQLVSIIPYGLPPEHIVGVVRGVLAEAEMPKLKHTQKESATDTVWMPEIDYEFEDLVGGWHRIADYHGEALVLNVWATWCEPCRRELPSLNRASRRLASEGIHFVALNWGDEPESVAAFLLDHPVDFPVWLDTRSEQGSGKFGANAKGLVVKGLPVTLLLDRQGRLVATLTGPRQWDSQEMLALLRRLP